MIRLKDLRGGVWLLFYFYGIGGVWDDFNCFFVFSYVVFDFYCLFFVEGQVFFDVFWDEDNQFFVFVVYCEFDESFFFVNVFDCVFNDYCFVFYVEGDVVSFVSFGRYSFDDGE